MALIVKFCKAILFDSSVKCALRNVRTIKDTLESEVLVPSETKYVTGPLRALGPVLFPGQGIAFAFLLSFLTVAPSRRS